VVPGLFDPQTNKFWLQQNLLMTEKKKKKKKKMGKFGVWGAKKENKIRH